MFARHPLGLLLLLGLLCLLSLGVSLSSGSMALSTGQVWDALWSPGTDIGSQLVRELRLPRSLAALTTGALLAVAGCLMQVLVRNPLADPYILGISGGASVAALLAMLAGVSGNLLTGSAFVGALVAMLLVFVLSRGHGQWNSNRLLLTGVVLAAGWGAAIGFILSLTPDSSLQRMMFWLMGDLGFARASGLPSLVLIVGLLASLLLARQLNVLTRGELVAGSLGIRTDLLHLAIYLIASLLTATAVTQAGSIGFVGLVVPHLIRLLGYHDHRILLPAAALLGASLLLLADTAARTLLAPQQLPVGILTAFIGVPLFLYLLYRGARQ
ncbi:iron ABC transporter permease [Thiohalophilus sp.]|uniref:FecCD family ABC transporter permease n=1 Tax=Thiohalophilus sp. TaxID=3028392 RepID=UPI002ACE7B68|nr:iron ABC transporter permease [Thiohalophilus sp.]MDZ7663645.1 iron ABC transporter permease [Thiohalophilus sp.]